MANNIFGESILPDVAVKHTKTTYARRLPTPLKALHEYDLHFTTFLPTKCTVPHRIYTFCTFSGASEPKEILKYKL